MTIDPHKKSNLVPAAVFLLLAVFYTLPFLLRLNNWGGRDWDLFTTIAAVPVGSIVHYGQFPFWNPWLAGGNILFHHPEAAVLSPFLILMLIFGAVVGLKLQVLVCYFLGLYGSFKMGTQMGMSRVAAGLMAVAYFGSVHFALHFAEGHMPFTHFCFLPWFLYYVLRSGENRRTFVGAWVVLALMILGNGAAIPLLYTLLFSSTALLLLSLRDRDPRLLLRLLVGVVGGFMLAAVKLVPMAVYLIQNRWAGNPDESIPLSGLGSIFCGLEHSLFVRNFPEQTWAWHEYGAYLSPLLILLALVALVLKFRRHWPWLVAAGLFLLLGLGNFGQLSPWNILSGLPGFGSARCTGRAFQFVILSMAVLGGFGYDIAREKFKSLSKPRLWRYALWGAVGVIVATNMALAWPIMSSAHRQEPIPVTREPEFRHVVDERPQAYRNYLANRGSLITPWLSAYHPSRGLVDAFNNVLPEHALSGEVTVVRRLYTPNRIEYEIEAQSPGQIVIGMGYDPGWRTDDGRSLEEHTGLISFGFEPGRSVIVMTYRPPWVWPGAVLSMLSLIALVVFCLSSKPKSNSNLT